MDSLDRAIYDIVHNSDITAKGIADRLGLSHQILLNKANPNNDSHKMTVRESFAIQVITGNQAVVNAMQAELTLSKRKTAPASVLACVLNAGKEHGDVLESIQLALEDDVITESEKVGIFKEIDEAEESLGSLREAVMSHGKPLGLAKH